MHSALQCTCCCVAPVVLAVFITTLAISRVDPPCAHVTPCTTPARRRAACSMPPPCHALILPSSSTAASPAYSIRTCLFPPLNPRLASDPGILGVMASHQYKVGKLSEMPPEGKVGVSPVCILGVNINAGQEISLRLRTDDLRVRPGWWGAGGRACGAKGRLGRGRRRWQGRVGWKPTSGVASDGLFFAVHVRTRNAAVWERAEK